MRITAVKFSKYFLKRPVWYASIILLIALILQWHSSHFNPRIFSSLVIRVIDGDTIVLNGLKIRLQGIDSPENKQTCTRKTDDKVWPCGLVARKQLIALINSRVVECTNQGKDKYQRQLCYCYAGDINLNAEMVKQGYAVAYIQYDIIFLLDELVARWYSRGIWGSDFIRPNVWRQQNKRTAR